MTWAEWEAEKAKVDRRRATRVDGFYSGVEASGLEVTDALICSAMHDAADRFPYPPKPLRELWAVYTGEEAMEITAHRYVVRGWHKDGKTVAHFREVE